MGLKNKNLFIMNMLRYILITIHRFILKFLKHERDPENIVVAIFGLTIHAYIVYTESFLSLNLIKNKSDYLLLGIPIFIICLPLLFWYSNNSPSKSELNSSKDCYTGIALFLIAMVLIFFFK